MSKKLDLEGAVKWIDGTRFGSARQRWDAVAEAVLGSRAYSSAQDHIRLLMQEAADMDKGVRAIAATVPKTPTRAQLPPAVLNRAGAVYTRVHGKAPEGSILPFVLSEWHEEWDEMYPELGAVLKDLLMPRLEALERLHAAKMRAELAKHAVLDAREAMGQLQQALVTELWNRGISLSDTSDLIPEYSEGRVMFAQSYRGGGDTFVVDIPDQQPVGSPAFLQQFKKIVGGNTLRIYSGWHVRHSDKDAGVHGPALILGGEGRGRKLIRIPIVNADDGMQVNLVRVGFRGSDCVLQFAEPADDEQVCSDYVLVVLNFIGGWRGDVEYDLPDGAVILATGEKAQGAAGYAGGWKEHLALIPVGSEVKYTTCGGGGHQGGTRWLRVLNSREVVHENETQRRERLARVAVEEGTVEWL